MPETVEVTFKCRMCGVSCVKSGSMINCASCGKKSGDAHKAANQLKKALKLANVLAKHGISAPEASAASEISPGVWNMAAELAGVTNPSDVTQALTIVLLRGDGL